MPLSLFHLHGDLKDLRVPRLLAALLDDRFTGVFQASVRSDSAASAAPRAEAAEPAAEITREIHFNAGHVAWAISTSPDESLKAYLLRHGAVTQAHWAEAEERAREGTVRQALIDSGAITAR